MSINGFGTFAQGQLVSALGQRYKTEQLGSLVITCPSASDIGLAGTDKRVPVVAHIRVNTSRHSSEWATDFIKRGRPFIFELNLDGGDSAAVVANKLEAAFNEYDLKFNNAYLPWITSNDASGTLTLVLRAGELSFQKSVTFLRNTDSYGLLATTSKYIASVQNDGTTANLLDGAEAANQTVITLDDSRKLSVGDIILIGTAAVIGVEGTAVEHRITAIANANTTDVTIDPKVPAAGYVDNAIVTVRSEGEEATNGGKYLEENMRMDTSETSGSYTIKPDEKPFISGFYTQIKWISKSTEAGGIGGTSGWAPHKHLSTVAADAKVGQRDSEFSLYFNEASLIETGGPVAVLVAFLIGGAPVIDNFKKADGQGAADVADFIA